MQILFIVGLMLISSILPAQAPVDFGRSNFIDIAWKSLALRQSSRPADLSVASEIQPEAMKLDNLILPITEVDVASKLWDGENGCWTNVYSDSARGIQMADTLTYDGYAYHFSMHRSKRLNAQTSITDSRGMYNPGSNRMTVTRKTFLSMNGERRPVSSYTCEYSPSGDGYLFYCIVSEDMALKTRVREYRMLMTPSACQCVISDSEEIVSLYETPPADWAQFTQRADFSAKMSWTSGHGSWENPATEKSVTW
jgi:hypothetical protein